MLVVWAKKPFFFFLLHCFLTILSLSLSLLRKKVTRPVYNDPGLCTIEAVSPRNVPQSSNGSQNNISIPEFFASVEAAVNFFIPPFFSRLKRETLLYAPVLKLLAIIFSYQRQFSILLPPLSHWARQNIGFRDATCTALLEGPVSVVKSVLRYTTNQKDLF